MLIYLYAGAGQSVNYKIKSWGGAGNGSIV
jgi:hypothetical protein